MTQEVLVTPKDGRPPFEGMIMGFANERVKVEWTTKERFLFLFRLSVNHCEYFSRSELRIATLEDEMELSDIIGQLWEQCCLIGWVNVQEGRWTHGEKVTGTVGIRGDYEEKIEARSLREFLQQALVKLDGKKK